MLLACRAAFRYAGRSTSPSVSTMKLQLSLNQRLANYRADKDVLRVCVTACVPSYCWQMHGFVVQSDCNPPSTSMLMKNGSCSCIHVGKHASMSIHHCWLFTAHQISQAAAQTHLPVRVHISGRSACISTPQAPFVASGTGQRYCYNCSHHQSIVLPM